MNSARDQFLQMVRQAVAKGNQAGIVRELERPSRIGYQGAGNDMLACFMRTFSIAGGHGHIVRSHADAQAKISELVGKFAAQRVLLGSDELLQRLTLMALLRNAGLEVWEEAIERNGEGSSKKTLFRADVGITGVDCLIAETGTIVQLTKPGQCRSLSLLPPVHIAVAERSQLLPDVFDAFARWEMAGRTGDRIDLPACISLITGPSKTGDIELRLVTGVHGPGELHVLLIDQGPST